MSAVVGGVRCVAAVVQDALTGEILWVGHLENGAPECISRSRTLALAGVAEGQPVAVRHMSTRGEGVVVHVETPTSRHQMDSIAPGTGESDSQAELAEFLAAISERHDSGRWAKQSPTDVAGATAGRASTLDEAVSSFQVAANTGEIAAIAAQAAAVLEALIETVEARRVPLGAMLSAFVRQQNT